MPAMRNQSQKIHARAVRVISSGLIPSPPRSMSGMTPLGTKYAAVQKSIVKKRMPAAPSHLRRDNAGRFSPDGDDHEQGGGRDDASPEPVYRRTGTRAVEVRHYRLRKRASPLWDQRDALINGCAQHRGEKKECQP